jgi:hypothetical protein
MEVSNSSRCELRCADGLRPCGTEKIRRRTKFPALNGLAEAQLEPIPKPLTREPG